MIQRLLNLVAPDDCLECSNEGAIWCASCRLDWESLPSRCFVCHVATADFAVCSSCRHKTGVRRLYVATEYKDTPKRLVRSLKFGAKRQAAAVVAEVLSEIPFYNPDLVVTSVPTSPARARQRGFDHTKLIAKELAYLRKLPYRDTMVRLNDLRQVGATKEQRSKQAVDAYRLRLNANVAGKHILLVDDVVTTGATLSETSRILRAAGAQRVDCIVFAYSK